MESGSIIIGAKLNEIQKTSDKVMLFFENPKTNESYVLTLRGLLFETSGSTLNKKVKNIQVNNTLGYRASSQLRYLKRDPQNYKQMYIQMEGSSEDNKFELLGAFRNFKISNKLHSREGNRKSIKFKVKKNDTQVENS